MPRFLIDLNLPYRFSIWAGGDYVHMRDLNERWKDQQIWEYACKNDMVIVSKDADFSDLAMLSAPPPRVVHIRFGNLKMREFHVILSRHWPWIVANITQFRLMRVYADRIECVAEGS